MDHQAFGSDFVSVLAPPRAAVGLGGFGRIGIVDLDLDHHEGGLGLELGDLRLGQAGQRVIDGRSAVLDPGATEAVAAGSDAQCGDLCHGASPYSHSQTSSSAVPR